MYGFVLTNLKIKINNKNPSHRFYIYVFRETKIQPTKDNNKVNSSVKYFINII